MNTVVSFLTVAYKPSVKKLGKRFQKREIIMIEADKLRTMGREEFKAQLARIDEDLDIRTVRFADDQGIDVLTPIFPTDLIDESLS